MLRAPGGSGGGDVGLAPRVGGAGGGGWVGRAGFTRGTGVSFASTIAVSSARRASEPGGGGGSVFCFLRGLGAPGIEGGVVGDGGRAEVGPDVGPDGGVIAGSGIRVGGADEGVTGRTADGPDGGGVFRPSGGASGTAETSGSTDQPDASSAIRS